MHRYYVVQFISRQNDEEATNEAIGNLLASQTVSEHVREIAETYTVTDVAGDLHYLTVPEETETGTDETAETESTDATETEETVAAETETAEETTAAVEETAEAEESTASDAQ